jgi:hypothetical protein
MSLFDCGNMLKHTLSCIFFKYTQKLFSTTTTLKMSTITVDTNKQYMCVAALTRLALTRHTHILLKQYLCVAALTRLALTRHTHILLPQC